MNLQARQARADQLRGREVRTLTTSRMELRSADGAVGFSGLASRTNTPYDMGWYDETITGGAFRKTLSESPDVQLLVNHEGLPLARTTNSTLNLRETDQGLEFDASCDGDDPDVARLATKVRAGLMDQCSFAFRVIRQKWTWVEDEALAAGTERDQREIQEVSLHRGDVSVCNYGANPNTNVTARSAFAELADLSDTELAEYREDPMVLTVVRRLGFVIPTPTVPADDTTPNEGLSLDLARARAWALTHRR